MPAVPEGTPAVNASRSPGTREMGRIWRGEAARLCKRRPTGLQASPTVVYMSFHFGVLFAAALLVTVPLSARQTTPGAVIWQDHGDITQLNLLSGPGGADGEPGADFRFLKESSTGTAPKFDVIDEHGTNWKVKLGEEGQSETAAARLLWAVGYIVDEDYYRPQIHVRDMKRLSRGQQFVSTDGTVTGARLERSSPGIDERTWSWYENPFTGTREFNGLRVMMALVNNWDLKEVNNVQAGARSSRVYGVSDLGSTFGRTGDVTSRSKGVSTDFADSRFVDAVTATHVDFVLHSRPFLPTAVNVPNYLSRTRMESIVKGIPRDDARWIGDRLGQLSAQQIGDCFRAGGFTAADVEIYTRVVMLRITALKALSPDPRGF